MDWIQLTTQDQLEEIKGREGYSVIFKHSTRCPISAMAKRRFEMDADTIPQGTPLYFLDLIKYREISNQIAEDFRVVHQSPQVLLINSGDCVLEASHGDISAEEVAGEIR